MVTTMSKPATPSQVSYLKHLLGQVGADEPDWDKLTSIDAGTLISDLKAKRGRPVWYGNGQFSHWEKKAMMDNRHAAKPKKIEDLLLKVVEGATTGIKLPEIEAIVSHLGGTFDEKLEIRESASANNTHYPTKEEAQAEADDYVREYNIKFYDRPPPDIRPYDGANSHIELRKERQGFRLIHHGWRAYPYFIVSLAGHTEKFYDASAAKKWLRDKVHWDDLAANALGVEKGTDKPSKARGSGGLGTCGVCFGVYKTRSKGGSLVMVMHGYERPGGGYVERECTGAGLPPFELSDHATKVALSVSLSKIDDYKDKLRDLKAGKTTKIDSAWYGFRESVILTPDSKQWDYAVKEYGTTLERQIEHIEKTIAPLKALVSHWKPRPLPELGGKAINWYTEGRTAGDMTTRVAARYLEVVHVDG